MQKDGVLFLAVLISTGSFVNNSFAEHIFANKDAFAQYLDISQLSGHKYVLEYEDQSFDIYYGFEGTIESGGSKNKPEVDSIDINIEKKSIDITFKQVPEDDLFWIRLPIKLIEAENEQYIVTVDGIQTKYDLTKRTDDYAVGMAIPKDSRIMEIHGTRIIPEFGSISILILVVAIILPIILKSKKSRFYD